MNILNIVVVELSETISRPSRIARLFDMGAIKRYLSFQNVRLLSRDNWISKSGEVACRNLESYDDYLTLQKSKLKYLDLEKHEIRFRKALRERISNFQDVIGAPKGARVLCLGARLGAEVAAFRDLEYFAIGVDLNPGQDNPWVMYGDFHHLEFPDNCVDIIYSNSLDHSFSLEGILSEVGRLLSSNGKLIVEADPGTSEGIEPDLWSTISWNTIEDLKREIQKYDFCCELEARFGYPRNGLLMIFRVKN